MRSIIASLVIIVVIVTIATAATIDMTVNMSINPAHVAITQFDCGGSNWTLSAAIHIPQNYVYTNLPIAARVDRMDVIVGPVEITDAQMQTILAGSYSAVTNAMALGSFSPGGAVRSALISAIAAMMETQ